MQAQVNPCDTFDKKYSVDIILPNTPINLQQVFEGVHICNIEYSFGERNIKRKKHDHHKNKLKLFVPLSFTVNKLIETGIISKNYQTNYSYSRKLYLTPLITQSDSKGLSCEF